MHHQVPLNKTATQRRHSSARQGSRPPYPVSRAAGETCWCARWASPMLKTCLIATRYGRSRNQTMSNSQHDYSWCRRPRIAKLAHTLTTAEQVVVGMFYCRVSPYLVAAGHEDVQGVANCSASCSRERWFQMLRRDKSADPFRFCMHTLDVSFKHHFPDTDVSVSVY